MISPSPYSTCVISAVRLWALMNFQPLDATYSTVPIALLSQLEPSLLITLGCIPLLRPLLGGRYSQNGTANFGASCATPRYSISDGQQRRRIPWSTVEVTSETQLWPGGTRLEHVAAEEQRSSSRGDSEDMGQAEDNDVELGMIEAAKT